jgi:hypothetical protein
VPSPVTATTWPFLFKDWTSRSLSCGEDLPITWKRELVELLILENSKVPYVVDEFYIMSSETTSFYFCPSNACVLSKIESPASKK